MRNHDQKSTFTEAKTEQRPFTGVVPAGDVDTQSVETRRSRRVEFEPHHLWSRDPVLVSEIMTKNLRAVTPESHLPEVAMLMKNQDIGVVPVVDPDGRLIGLVTDRDLVIRAMVEGPAFAERTVRKVMTESPDAVHAQESIANALALMGRLQVRRLPVVDAVGRLVGMVSLSDVATRADHHDELQETLVRISSRRSMWARLWG